MDKWISICVVGVVLSMFSPLMVMEYSKKECRIEAIKAGMSADDIIKLCAK